MSELTLLSALKGFAEGDIDTDGYVAAIHAFQSIFWADGRNFDNKGYHKLEFHTDKIKGVSAGAAVLIFGEAVKQVTQEAAGFYLGCEEVKLTITGSIGDVDVPFQLGERVDQATSTAFGYVTSVGLASDGTGSITVCPVSRDETSGATIDFSAASDTVTGATSGATAAVIGAVSAIGVGDFHFIYRTTTVPFVVGENIISNNTPANFITPTAAAGAIQHVYTVTGAGSSGTFTLTYEGETTTDIAFDANAATIKTALEVLSTVAVDDITVTFQSGSDFSAVTPTNAMILTFATDLGSVNPVSGTESMGTATAIVVKTFTSGHLTITAPPHWRTWKPVATFDTAANPGLMPDGGSNIGVLCFGRIFLNSMSSPHLWFCTRRDDPNDFDSSKTDVASSTNSQNQEKAGLVGSPIIAMISHKDQYLIMGCENDVYIMRSDPLYGGINANISKGTGFFSPTSWTWDDQNNLYFVGVDGIYKISTDTITRSGTPENLTKARNPKLISSLGLNRRTDRVAMGFDKTRYGIEISVTQMDGVSRAVFWLDLRTGGLFPDELPTDQSPASMLFLDSRKSSERKLLLGGYDGFIRTFDDLAKSDEGSNAIDAFFTTGPFVDSTDVRNKILTDETSITTGEGTDGITVEIYRGNTGDEVVANVKAGATPAATKTLTGDGLRGSMRNRVGGRAIAMKFKNTTADESFSIEEIITNIKQTGKKK